MDDDENDYNGTNPAAVEKQESGEVFWDGADRKQEV